MAHVYVTYDSQADVLLVEFERPEGTPRGSRDHGGSRFVEYGPDGTPFAVEFLDASVGVDPTGLPLEAEIREALQNLTRVVNIPAQA